MRAAGLKPSSDVYHQICELREDFEEFRTASNKQLLELHTTVSQVKESIDWVIRNLCKRNGEQT